MSNFLVISGDESIELPASRGGRLMLDEAAVPWANAARAKTLEAWSRACGHFASLGGAGSAAESSATARHRTAASRWLSRWSMSRSIFCDSTTAIDNQDNPWHQLHCARLQAWWVTIPIPAAVFLLCRSRAGFLPIAMPCPHLPLPGQQQQRMQVNSSCALYVRK